MTGRTSTALTDADRTIEPPTLIFVDEGSAGAPIEVVAWVCVRDNALLGARSRGQSMFYVPGGKTEPGEDDVAALLREVGEELAVCLDPGTVELLTVVEAHGHGTAAGRRVRMACYAAEPTTASASPMASREIAEIAWLGLRDRDRFAPADQVLLDYLSARGTLH